MKVFAIGTVSTPASEDEKLKIMKTEVPETLQLYLTGKVEQFWGRQDKHGPIFLFDVESVDEAKQIIDAMPMVVGGIATYEYIPVGPLMVLRRLLPTS